MAAFLDGLCAILVGGVTTGAASQLPTLLLRRSTQWSQRTLRGIAILLACVTLVAGAYLWTSFSVGMRAAITVTPPWGNQAFAPAPNIILQRATWHSLFGALAGDPCSGLTDKLCAGVRYLSFPLVQIWPPFIAATIASIIFGLRWSRRDAITNVPTTP